jgi:hypothetical protein
MFGRIIFRASNLNRTSNKGRPLNRNKTFAPTLFSNILLKLRWRTSSDDDSSQAPVDFELFASP